MARLFLTALLLCAFSFASQGRAEPPLLEMLLQHRVDAINSGAAPQVAGARLGAAELIPAFYRERGYRLAWEDPADVQDLIVIVGGSYERGLAPGDYHLPLLVELLRQVRVAQAPEPERRVELDLLLTDSLARLASDAYFGKVDPLDRDGHWNLRRRFDGQEPAHALNQLLGRGELEERFSDLIQPPQFYRRLQQALGDYRKLAAAGGWPRVPEGPILEFGDQGERPTLLRERLRISGDLGSQPVADPALFDAVLEAGVKAFQERHGLAPDGKVGPRTLAALNQPVSARIRQIRVNMERARWLQRDLPDDFLLVDIAGFRASLVRSGKEVWQSRAQVGRAFRETPVFRADLTYMELNPTWTVPPTVLEEDILPQVRQDPGYLTKRNFRVLDARGVSLDPSTIDWSLVSGRNSPYLLRQDPGPQNALGRIKFMFPNLYSVYLHDTPSKSLFERPQRAFSSGCIRIEDPLTLAELLLRDPRWDRARIAREIGAGRTSILTLERPLPVLLLYWTAEVGHDGRVYFREDLYQRDTRLLQALNAPPRARAERRMQTLAETQAQRIEFLP
jgi:murein L,D-transpeptidase YcbB/YkuD